MAEGTDKIKDDLRGLGEETAAIFQEALTSIAASFGEKLKAETSTLDDAQKSLLQSFKNNIKSTANSASLLVDIQTKLRDGSIKENDLLNAKASIDTKINRLAVTRNSLLRSGVKLSDQDNERAEDAIQFAKDQKSEFTALQNIQAKINDELGSSGAAFAVIDKLFKSIGINSPFGEALAQTKANRASLALNNAELDKIDGRTKRAKELKKENLELVKKVGLLDNVLDKLSEQATLSNANLAINATLTASFLKQFSAINEAQVESQRLTGEVVKRQNLYNNSLVLSADYLKQVNSLTEQFGFNTGHAFDEINIQEAAELSKFMGLSATESGVLARNAQISGENLKDGADQAIRAINPAFSQKKILQDIAKLSASITTSFGNSNVALAKAASDAKELGLNLDQVDKIAGGLLDIESSIAAEFEAEVISGKQLNLERARYFALTNDLAGVTKELTNQGITQESFAKSNRIEQEAVAKAIGLSRDELAASLQEQALLAGMSASDIKDKEAADFKRQTLQDEFNDSIAKMSEALAGPAAAFANILASSELILPIILAVTAGVKAMNIALAIQNGLRKIGVLTSKNQLKSDAAGAALTALKNPFVAAAGIVAAVAVGAIASGIMSKADDMVSPKGYGSRILSGPEGSIALNNNDTVIAGTNLGQTISPPPPPSISITPDIIREENRNNNPTINYDQLADAIAMGAEKGTSRANISTNLDGSKVSNRIQAPLAMNTRKYSV